MRGVVGLISLRTGAFMTPLPGRRNHAVVASLMAGR